MFILLPKGAVYRQRCSPKPVRVVDGVRALLGCLHTKEHTHDSNKGDSPESTDGVYIGFCSS